MSRFHDSGTGAVFHVPDALDAMYLQRPEVTLYDEAAAALEAAISPAVGAPAGSTGAPVPTYDPDAPLYAGVPVFLDNIDSATVATLDLALDALSLPIEGNKSDKIDALKATLTEEAPRG